MNSIYYSQPKKNQKPDSHYPDGPKSSFNIRVLDMNKLEPVTSKE